MLPPSKMTVIVGREYTWLGDRRYDTPAGLYRDPGTIAKLVHDYSPAVVLTVMDPAMLASQLGPYRFTPTETVGTTWQTYSNPDRQYVSIGRLGAGDEDDMLAGSDRDVYLRCSWWLTVTGSPYHTSPGTAAIVNMQQIPRHRKFWPTWILKHRDIGGIVDFWRPPGQVFDLFYGFPSREPAVMKAAAVGLHQYDMRMAYLAGAAAVELPYARMTNTDIYADPYDNVGYYRVRLTPGTLPARLMGLDRDDCVWMCHPTLRLLRSAHFTTEVVQALTAPVGRDDEGRPSSSRILRPWAESWRDAVKMAPDPIKDLLKQGYKQSVGGLIGAPRGTIYRPDWRHMVMDQVRSSTLRRILAVGETNAGGVPAAINVDSLYYTHQVDPGVIGVGDHMGNMRYEGVQG